MSLGKTEGIVFIIGSIIGITGIFILLPSDYGTYNYEVQPEPGSFLFRGFLEGDDDTQFHSIRLLENPISMHVILKCSGNDFDIYFGRGYTPTEDDYDVRGYAAGGEDFTYNQLEEGIWHIMVQSYSGSGQYELRIYIDY